MTSYRLYDTASATSPVADDDILPSRHACNEIKETRSVVVGVHPHTHAHPLKQFNEVSKQLATKTMLAAIAMQIVSYIWHAL